MNTIVYRCLLDMIMCLDKSDFKPIRDYDSLKAKELGYSDWVEAYHEL